MKQSEMKSEVYPDVDFLLFLFKLQNDHLPSGAANEQSLGSTTENNLLYSQLGIITERIKCTGLQVTTKVRKIII